MNVARHVRHLGYFIMGVTLMGSVLAASQVDAATYYVATTGKDTNSGTEAAPFRTLTQGVKGLKPGDTLYVKSGTYAESLVDKIPGGGSDWGSAVTVAAYPGHTVTLRPGAGSSFVLKFSGSSTKYIVIDGLILDGVNVEYDVVKITYTKSGAAHHIRIKNSEVKNGQINNVNADQSTWHGHGILVLEGSNNNEFINLKVHHNGASDFDHGFYIRSSNNLVENCQVYENAGWGGKFYWDGQSGKVNNNILRNNKLYDNARLGNRGAGWVVSNGTGNLLYNNLVWGNNGGIQVDFQVSNTKVYNNTVYGNTGYGIKIGDKSTGAMVRNNIVYGNSGKNPVYDSGNGTVLSNNLLNVDPKFVNAASKDFRLQASSPAINKGMTLSEVPKDHVGVSRPQSGTYDIGGYEKTGSTSSSLVAAPMNPRISDSN